MATWPRAAAAARRGFLSGCRREPGRFFQLGRDWQPHNRNIRDGTHDPQFARQPLA